MGSRSTTRREQVGQASCIYDSTREIAVPPLWFGVSWRMENPKIFTVSFAPDTAAIPSWGLQTLKLNCNWGQAPSRVLEAHKMSSYERESVKVLVKIARTWLQGELGASLHFSDSGYTTLTKFINPSNFSFPSLECNWGFSEMKQAWPYTQWMLRKYWLASKKMTPTIWKLTMIQGWQTEFWIHHEPLAHYTLTSSVQWLN